MCNICLIYSKMPPYFELKLEIYSFMLNDTHTSAHAKLVKSISRAVGKTFVKNLRDQENQVEFKKKGSINLSTINLAFFTNYCITSS